MSTRNAIPFLASMNPGFDDPLEGRPHILKINLGGMLDARGEPFPKLKIGFHVPRDLLTTLRAEAVAGRFPVGRVDDVALAGEVRWRLHHAKVREAQEKAAREAAEQRTNGRAPDAGSGGQGVEPDARGRVIPWWQRLNGVSWGMVAALAITGILYAVTEAVRRLVGAF